MQSPENRFKLYFALPQKLYSQQKLILCCGYCQFEFDRVELWAGKQKIGVCKPIPHYDKTTDKVVPRAFSIIGFLTQINEHTEIRFQLHFIKASEKIECEAGVALVEIPSTPQKIDALQPNTMAIVLPTYKPNMVLFIKQINSILEQSYINTHTKHSRPSIEIIIQDDGSDKETIEQIEQFIKPFDNIQFFQNKSNLGFYNNIESLLYRIGEGYSYLAFSDQDDIWHPKKLEKQIERLKKNRADLVYSDLEIVDENLRQLQSTFWLNRSNHINDYHALCVRNVATGSTMLFKRALLQKLLPFPQQTGKVYHDHWIAAFFKNKQYKVHYIDEPLVQYIQHENNVTGYQSFKKLSLNLKALSFLSLIFIFFKIIFKKDLSDLNKFITLHQDIYFTKVQRLKLFYVHLGNLDLAQYNSIKTDIILIIRLFFLSFKSIFKPLYLNRFEVSMYSAIIVMFALRLRHFFNKKDG